MAQISNAPQQTKVKTPRSTTPSSNSKTRASGSGTATSVASSTTVGSTAVLENSANVKSNPAAAASLVSAQGDAARSFTGEPVQEGRDVASDGATVVGVADQTNRVIGQVGTAGRNARNLSTLTRTATNVGRAARAATATTAAVSADALNRTPETGGSAPDAARQRPASASPGPDAGVNETTARPRRQPISDDMRVMVDDMERAGVLPETQQVAPRRIEPRTDDMRAMVDDIERARAEVRTTPTPDAPPATVDTPSAAGAVDDVAGVGAADDAARTGGRLSRVARGADRVLGPLGVVAGGYTAVQGAQRLANGEVVGGGLQVVEGTAGAVSGGAATVGALATGTAVTAGAATLAAGGAGIAAMADGIGDVYESLEFREGQVLPSVQNPEQLGVGVAKTAGGALMTAGAATLNPIAIGAGAAVYAGAVIYENREAIGEFATNVGRGAVNVASSVVEGVGNAASSVGRGIASGVSSAWNWAFG